MIDLHFHCLPAIDDGPPTSDDAVALCRAAAADGIHTIVATPHVLRDGWLNTDRTIRDQLVADLNALLGGTPLVLPGCELYFCADAVELWHLGADGPLTSLNRSRYLLLEFPPNRVPERAEAVIHEFVIAGVRPIIAHPERNAVLSASYEKLQRLADLGALMQITAASVTGGLGPAVRKICDDFFERDLIHFVASDAHSVHSRPPALAAARTHVRREWGPDAETAFFEVNPKIVIDDAEWPSA